MWKTTKQYNKNINNNNLLSGNAENNGFHSIN